MHYNQIKDCGHMAKLKQEVHNTSLLPILPLKNVVMLPRSINPIIVGRAVSLHAVEYALKHDKSVFITAQKQADTENPTENDIFTYGTRGTILQVARMPKGSVKILVEGFVRSKIVTFEQAPDHSFLLAQCQDVLTVYPENTLETEALWRHLQSLYTRYTQVNAKTPADLFEAIKTIEDMDYLVDTLAMHISLSFDDRQAFLEISSLNERLLKICVALQKEIDILETEEKIKGRVQTQVEKNQREYYLTEQIKAIQKELGKEDTQGELQELRAKMKNLGLSAEAHEKVDRELKRLEQMPPLTAEAVVSRNYIDWILSLPWKKATKDSISLTQAEKILDKNHQGLQKPKERIVEFIAAKKFSKTLERSPIICLVGPPGVGKTSLGKSIADALGREFVRISLGGIRDEAEIRGHRRTYIGALPGKFIQAMRRAKTVNPVIMLDEIDKIAADAHGDPAAALLEVLDPEQNKSFVDHFMEVEYDLSKVMFIATANHTDGIPYALFDRMEIITLSGYTDQEKLAIAQQFLLPKTLKEYGLKPSQVKISSEIMILLINDYTKEAGVRQLERVIAKLSRKIIQIFLKDSSIKTIAVTTDYLKTWLGSPKFKKTVLAGAHQRIGVATGLAWTELGGDVLEIEVAVLPGKGNITLTGQLGEVMQESAQAALSYIRSRATEFHLKSTFNATKDIHIHVPEGATPKDGPSAGITIAIALISALTKLPTRNTVAMTGEITLLGRILGVGGLKEKILAAQHHGVTTICLPYENKDEITEIKNELDTKTHLVFVSSIDQALEHVFEHNPLTHNHNGINISKHDTSLQKAKKLSVKKRKTSLPKKG
jgi:ATP-dependent Lon protease